MSDRPAAAPTGPRGPAFLLAQLGSHATARFAERIAALDLTPPLVGLLGAVAGAPGSSQSEIAGRLGLFPSRLVAMVDTLEERGLVRRERSRTDRRQYSLLPTDAGRDLLRRVGQVARAHDRDLCAALTADERDTLTALLARVAQQQGLAPGVHPGFRRLGWPNGPGCP